MQPTVLCDSYKNSHYNMYPKDMTMLYSNLTARKSRIEGVNSIVFFGLEYFLQEYLVKQWNTEFFGKPWSEVKAFHLEHVRPFCGGNEPSVEQWMDLYDLQYLPIRIKALPEGMVVPIGIPMLTITNTHSKFAWLVNFLETIISTTLWQPIVSATKAKHFRELLEEQTEKYGGDPAFIDWQGHDFSMRGMSSLESAMLSGAGHLTSFKGSDTIPAAVFLKKYYNTEDELIAASVPATEHSVMCVGTLEDEIGTFRRLMEIFPTGILSIVSDTWSLPKVVAQYLPLLKDEIKARDGKIVIRPDSFWTDPADCLCGFSGYHPQMDKLNGAELQVIRKGLIESLGDIFGWEINEKGFKVLPACIGAIYGDAINYERADQIGGRLMGKGIAPTVVYGIGSFTYQYNTRDTIGAAMKATACVVGGEFREIYKDPVTDSGEKKSAVGLLQVYSDAGGNLKVRQRCESHEERGGLLRIRFINGEVIESPKLKNIRELIKSQKLI